MRRAAADQRRHPEAARAVRARSRARVRLRRVLQSMMIDQNVTDGGGGGGIRQKWHWRFSA